MGILDDLENIEDIFKYMRQNRNFNVNGNSICFADYHFLRIMGATASTKINSFYNDFVYYSIAHMANILWDI